MSFVMCCPCSKCDHFLKDFVLTVQTVTIRVPEITPRVYGLPGLYEFLKRRARFVGRCVQSLGRLVDSFARRLKKSYKPYKPCTNRPTNRARHIRNSYKPYKPLRLGFWKITPWVYGLYGLCESPARHAIQRAWLARRSAAKSRN